MRWFLGTKQTCSLSTTILTVTTLFTYWHVFWGSEISSSNVTFKTIKSISNVHRYFLDILAWMFHTRMTENLSSGTLNPQLGSLHVTRSRPSVCVRQLCNMVFCEAPNSVTRTCPWHTWDVSLEPIHYGEMPCQILMQGGGTWSPPHLDMPCIADSYGKPYLFWMKTEGEGGRRGGEGIRREREGKL